MGQMNKFENFPLFQVTSNRGFGASVYMHMVEIPDNISFNTVAVILTWNLASSHGVSRSYSFGLYSLTGSTLSLINSASNSYGVASGIATNFISWLTLATSATYNISAGNWFFAILHSVSSVGALGTGRILNFNVMDVTQSVYGGPFFRGVHSVSTAALPASINTSDMTKDGAILSLAPYILIAA